MSTSKKTSVPVKSAAKKTESNKEDQKKVKPIQKIAQPEKDDAKTQSSIKENAKTGEPIHTPLGSKILEHGINVDLDGE